MKSVFTEEQKQFIVDNFKKYKPAEIAEMLGGGITKKQVKSFGESRGLKRGTGFPARTPKEKEYILKWYNKKQTGEIAKDLGLTTKQVNDFAYNQGLESEVTRYELNENFFDVIDTEEKAYWLGFLYADGTITPIKRKDYIKSYTLEIGLARKDKSHLEKMKKSIGSTHEIVDKMVKDSEVSRLRIYSTKMCRNLIDKGCTPTKSLTLTFPSEDILPKELVRHFIRGYLDGDGCVYAVPEKYAYIVNFIGTREFLESIQNVFAKEIGLTKTAIKAKGRAFQTQWGGRLNMVKIRSYLYSDCSICLERKQKKIDVCIA